MTAIAYETIQLENGSLPLLTPMSEVAGPDVGPNRGATFAKAQGRKRSASRRRSRGAAGEGGDHRRRDGRNQCGQNGPGPGSRCDDSGRQSRPAAGIGRHFPRTGADADVQQLQYRTGRKAGRPADRSGLGSRPEGAAPGDGRDGQIHVSGVGDCGRGDRPGRVDRDDRPGDHPQQSHHRETRGGPLRLWPTSPERCRAHPPWP